MILVRNYIKKNNLWNSIKIVCQVHDQIDTVCIAEMANEWKIKLDELMVEAGKVIIPSGILRSDVNLSPFWTK